VSPGRYWFRKRKKARRRFRKRFAFIAIEGPIKKGSEGGVWGEWERIVGKKGKGWRVGGSYETTFVISKKKEPAGDSKRVRGA